MSKPTKKTKERVAATPAAMDHAALRIDNILRLASGSVINKVAALYAIIMNVPESIRPALLRMTAENFGLTDSAEKRAVPDKISDGERDALKGAYGKTVDAMLDALVHSNPSVEGFYGGLYSLIQNPFFHKEHAKIFALYYVLIDKRIPYYQLPEGLRMSDEEFQDRLRRNRGLRMQLAFVLACKYEQRTEEADIILKLLSQADERDRVVLLVSVLHTVRRDIERVQALQERS